ncbi:putative uncharacterized protein [Clostridium sp. CAG:1013]|nr:putative uncharacterized protein [Clostridium sp. CAG:1013]
MGTRPLFHAVQPRGQNARVIEDQAVVGGEVVHNFVKMAVLDGAGSLVQKHQTGGVPRFNGGLSDQLFRQIKVKITCFHRFYHHFLF